MPKVPCTKEFRDLEKAKRKSDLAWSLVDITERGLNVGGAAATVQCGAAVGDPTKLLGCAQASFAFVGGLIGFSALLVNANDADLDAEAAANEFVDCVGDHKEYFGEDFYNELKY